MLRKAFTPLDVRLMSITLLFVAKAFVQGYLLSTSVAPYYECFLIPYKNDNNITFPIMGQLYSLRSYNFSSSSGNSSGQWIGLVDCGSGNVTIQNFQPVGSSVSAIVLGHPDKCEIDDNLSYPLFNVADNNTCLNNFIHALGNLTISGSILGNNDSNNNSNSNNGTSMDSGNNNYGGNNGNSVLATYQTAMIVLYAVSGVVLGLFFLVVLTNIIKNRLRPSTTIVNNGNDGNNRNQPRGIARAVLESFPVYLFSLGGVTSPTPGDANNKNPIDSSEKGIKKEYNGDYIELETIPSPEDNIPNEQSNTSPNVQANETIPDGDDSLEIKQNPIIAQLKESHTRENSGTSTSSSSNITDEQLTCPICLGDFESGEELRILPCHHQYHTSCIDPWLLDISPLCPMCKADFTTWSIDVSANAPGDDIPSVSTTSVDSSGDVNIQIGNNNVTGQTGQGDNDDASSLASSNSPHAFPHFRWIKYLTTIRRAGRRRRRSRRPAARHSVDPSRSQENNNDLIVPGTIVEVNEGREARLYRATM